MSKELLLPHKRFMPYVTFFLCFIAVECTHISTESTTEPDCEEGYFYIYDRQKVHLCRLTQFVSIAFDDSLTKETCVRILKEHSLEPVDTVFRNHYLARSGQTDASEYYTSHGGTSARSLDDSSFVRYSLPVYWHRESKRLALLTDRFFSRFSGNVSRKTIDSLNSVHGVELFSDDPLLGGAFLLKITKASRFNTLEVSNIYGQLPIVESASPDFAWRIEFY